MTMNGVMKRLLLLLPLVTSLTIAGTTGILEGYVFDKNSGEPLIGASVAIAGTSMGAATDLEGYFKISNIEAGTYDVRISNVGFTTDKDLYMSAADILLGKTGGLTTSEALAKGLAFVIVDPIEGQEERNADHLLEEGVAIRCNNLPVLGYKVDKLLSDPVRLTAMQKKSRQLGHPRAAFSVVDTLINMP